MDDTKQQTDNGKPVKAPHFKKMMRKNVITGGNKEFSPIQVQKVEAPLEQFIDSHGSEKTPELPKEVELAGVEAVQSSERPTFTPEHKAAGVMHAKEAVPMMPQSQSVQLPYTHAQIVEMKKVSTKEGKHWIAVFVEYLGKKMQLT